VLCSPVHELELLDVRSLLRAVRAGGNSREMKEKRRKEKKEKRRKKGKNMGIFLNLKI
jgi:hypothetical protein